MTSKARALLRFACVAGGVLGASVALADDRGSSGVSYRLESGAAELASPSALAAPVHVGGSGLGLLPPGQEVVLTTTPSSARMPDWLLSPALSPTLSPTQRAGLDHARATYRYTFFETDAWAYKLGLTASLLDNPATWRPALGSDRWRLGSTPMMHLSASGHYGDRWQLSVDADGLHTGRGHALDLDLRVDYGLGHDLFLYGGYRLVESGGDAEDLYGPSPNNSANVGIRFRF